jgi:putative phosphoribosyl transferase
MYFANRNAAGRWLGAALEPYRSTRPLVLALPRGGVPVGYEVAHALGTELDVLVVRKIGAPGNPELAIGAVAPDVVLIDDEAVQALGVSEPHPERALRRAQQEMQDGLERFRGTQPRPDVRQRTVILVDDGIATGATAPVCSRPAAQALRSVADDVVCLYCPEPFAAVGYWYADFAQTTDQEVRDLLKQARLEREAHLEPVPS